MHILPNRIDRLTLPGRVPGSSARQADLELLAVAPENFLDTTHFDTVRFPPLQFTPLVLGYRTWQELKAAFPDVDVTPKARLLVDTLFPKTESFIYTLY